jgi:serine/threonine protein kinase
MNAPSRDRVKQVYRDVLDHPPDERGAYVRELCGEDRALQAEVESLLATHKEAGRFGEQPAIELLDELPPGADSRPLTSVGRGVQPGDRLGVYEIRSLVGAGGMGEVYKARDSRLDRTVAIKVLPPQFAADRDRYQRFEREARAVASLDHPHIGALYDVGQDEGVHFLVMQYLDGETLASRLAKGALPLDKALRYAIDVAEALDHAHRRGIVHRDLKPGNIVLTKTGAMLLDFGLAKWHTTGSSVADGLTAAPTAHGNLTAEGTIAGTLHYMAPEQLEGKDTDARTDLFAFGAVVYEMVTGRRAFGGGSSASVIAAILDKQPPAMSTLRPLTPSALDHVITTCLAKDADERWQSAADLKRELRWIADSGAKPPSVGQVRSSLTSRAVVIAGVIGVLIGSVVSTAVWNNIRARSTTPPLKVTRSIVSLPAGATLGVDDSSLALSPDGTRLAYIVRRGDNRQIYVRVQDEFDAKPIAGTEGAASPFFSPDSRWLGFSVPGKLKKVAISGGAPQTICDTEAPLGATWAPDNTIVLAASFKSGLSKCAATGGVPQVLTAPDPVKHEKSHRFPQFLPGGRAVLFTIITADMASPDEARIAVLSLDTGQVRVLLEGGISPSFVSTGHLVYVRGSSLVAVPFDPRRLEVTGQSVPVLDSVITNPASAGVSQFGIADSGLLAYAPGAIRGIDRRVVWVNRSGQIERLMDPQRAFQALRLSLDGQWLALSIGGVNDQMWLYDIARHTLTRLTSAWDNAVQAWTPDGRHIVFRSDRSGDSKFRWQLYWQTPDGSGPVERLDDRSEPTGSGSWSPDGKVFVFSQWNAESNADIWLLTIGATRAVRPLIRSPFNQHDPRLSADGRWLAYVSDESGRPEVYVQRFPGLGAKWQISTGGGSEPVWEPHGRELFYQDGVKMMAVSIQAEPTFVAGTPRLLFEGAYVADGWGTNYDVAPDGRFIMIQLGQSEAPATHIALVQNWFEELKRRVPIP